MVCLSFAVIYSFTQLIMSSYYVPSTGNMKEIKIDTEITRLHSLQCPISKMQ